MRLVPVGGVKIGSIVARTIYDDNGRILLKNGVALTESLIDKLKNNQVLGVYIFDHYSQEEIQDVIRPELRNKAIKEVKTVFQAVRMQIEQSIREMESSRSNMNKRLKKMVDQKYLDRLDNVIGDMIDELTYNKDAMVGLVDIKNMKSFVYQHSIQVTILSLLVGVAMHMDGKMLKELAMGAMLHDIGLTFIDKKLIMYSPEFTEAETEHYRQHCELGHEFIKENTFLPVASRMGILQHHEEYNGMGFPLGLSEDQIHLNARIIAVANDYDKMTSGVMDHMVQPNEAIEYIMGNAGKGRKYDFEIANLFVRRVLPYPLGSYVILSTGEKAVVHAINASHPLRPVVKLIQHPLDYDELPIVNLLDNDRLNITIKTLIVDEEDDEDIDSEDSENTEDDNREDIGPNTIENE